MLQTAEPNVSARYAWMGGVPSCADDGGGVGRPRDLVVLSPADSRPCLGSQVPAPHRQGNRLVYRDQIQDVVPDEDDVLDPAPRTVVARSGGTEPETFGPDHERHIPTDRDRSEPLGGYRSDERGLAHRRVAPPFRHPPGQKA